MKNIRWLICLDCDGVLTDYKCYFNEAGRHFKVFNSKDSYAIKKLLKLGHLVYVISSDIDSINFVRSRSKSWGIESIASNKKLDSVRKLKSDNNNLFDKVCFVGNGPEDLEVLSEIDIFLAPKDSRPEIFITNNDKVKILDVLGGDGVLDKVMLALSL